MSGKPSGTAPVAEDSFPPRLPTNVPTSARCYDYALGGKDNFAVDRGLVLRCLHRFPEVLDAARENRLFLYRAVRYLARERGIRQFLDMGGGLPMQENVHQIARRFQPDARVVYADKDPIVLAHARALLDEDPGTAVIAAEASDGEKVLEHPEIRRLIDFTRPVGVLFLWVPHSITDDAQAHRALRAPLAAAASGSCLAATQMVAEEAQVADQVSRYLSGMGMPWRTRTPHRFGEFLTGSEPAAPGLVDVADWRPDPGQPPLSDVDEPLRPYLGASGSGRRLYTFGGVLTKP